ncbi:glycosyltransferase, partial [bacterium]|nr:glycosyltransferase [bacterium]
MSALAPVVVFAYNRPDHLEKTLLALSRNELAAETGVTVYSDGSRDAKAVDAVNGVRKLVREFKGFKSLALIEREVNFGLAKNIISGVGEAVARSGKVI